MARLTRLEYMHALRQVSEQLHFMNQLLPRETRLLHEIVSATTFEFFDKPDAFKLYPARYKYTNSPSQLNHIIARFYLKFLYVETGLRLGREAIERFIWAPANLVPTPMPLRTVPEFKDWGSLLDLPSAITAASALAHAWCQDNFSDSPKLKSLAPPPMHFRSTKTRTRSSQNGQVMGISIAAFSQKFLNHEPRIRRTYNIFVITYVQSVLARCAYLWGIVQAGIFYKVHHPLCLTPVTPINRYWWDRAPDGRSLYAFAKLGFDTARESEVPADKYAIDILTESFAIHTMLTPNRSDLYSIYSEDNSDHLPRPRGSALTEEDIREWEIDLIRLDDEEIK